MPFVFIRLARSISVAFFFGHLDDRLRESTSPRALLQGERDSFKARICVRHGLEPVFS
jgi:hypothetical protein